jgi:hypothetical protein
MTKISNRKQAFQGADAYFLDIGLKTVKKNSRQGKLTFFVSIVRVSGHGKPAKIY